MAGALATRGKYVQAFEILLKVVPNLPPQDVNEASESAKQYRIRLGENFYISEQSEKRHEKNQPRFDNGNTVDLTRFHASDALAEIINRAKNTRIVILNEDHESPRDRAFGLAVAKALRPLGYNKLAIEALTGGDDDYASNLSLRVSRDGFVRPEDGFYTLDPVFSDFIRQSIKSGYKISSYEALGIRTGAQLTREQRISTRERGQAENIARRLFSETSEDKILIYVGYAHVKKGKDDNGIRWLAEALRERLGINPLTIDQATSEKYNIGDKFFDQSVIFLDTNKSPVVFGDYSGRVDIQVFHGPSRMQLGRPSWLWRMGRKAVSVPVELAPRSGCRLIQAFVDSEGQDAIPVDQIVVFPQSRQSYLAIVPNKRHRYSYQDPDQPDLTCKYISD